MAKRKSRKPPKLTEAESEIGSEIVRADDEFEILPEIPEPRSQWLSGLRASTVKAQAEAAHTIAELQAWRDEIDSTIAFLKAQRKQP